MRTFKNNHIYIYILQVFQDMNKKARRVVNHSEDLQWKPPNYGLYKINFDGALFDDQASAGLGVVIRDWEGQIIAALSQKVRYPNLVDLVEAFAGSRAINFAKELNIHQMVVEGDSLRVIQTINDAKPVRTMYGHVIDDIRILSSTVCCSFLHVKRKGNKLPNRRQNLSLKITQAKPIERAEKCLLIYQKQTSSSLTYCYFKI